MLNPNDIPGTSEEEWGCPSNVQDAVKWFLDGQRVILEPHLLNPFLKCLENMKKGAKIELDFSFKHEPYYKISHPIRTMSNGCLSDSKAK